MSKIIGNTTATPNPRPDWLQTDETKADFIKNKPNVDALFVMVETLKEQVEELYTKIEELTGSSS